MMRHFILRVVLAAALAVGLAGTGAGEPAPLLVGYAEADITPPLGGSMPGYFGDRKATAVLDPLMAKALVLRQGSESVAVVQCDLIGMGAPIVKRIRDEVRRRVRPAPRHVWVHCSHTHTGGMVPRGDSFTSDAERIYPGFYPGAVDAAWVERLVGDTAEAVRRAVADAQPEGALTLHTGQEDTVARYRRYVMRDGSVRTNPGRNNPQVVRPAGEIDPRVHVLRFGAARVAAVLYGCHPDCVGGTGYSADYPGHLCAALRERLGAGWRVVFWNTCSGNINHVNVADAGQRSGPEESRRLGRKLADAAWEALGRGEALAPHPLRVGRGEVDCRLRRPRPEEVALAEERIRSGTNLWEFNGLMAPAAKVLAETRDREHEAEIAALRLGGFALAAMPGEVFVELAREVEAASPFRPTRTLGLTNGSMGYIPTRQGYTEGGYEAGYRSARYEPDTGHRWAATAARLLREMR
jgi:neutral ceramidase